MSRTWRDEARPLIAEVIGCFSPGDDERVIKKAVMATYPWGEREMWPYKVWCDETKRQLAARRKREPAAQQPVDALPLFAAAVSMPEPAGAVA